MKLNYKKLIKIIIKKGKKQIFSKCSLEPNFLRSKYQIYD